MPRACPKCGNPAQPDDLICRKCGAVIVLRSGQEDQGLEAEEEEKIDDAVREALTPEKGDAVERAVMDAAPPAAEPPAALLPAASVSAVPAVPSVPRKKPSAGRKALPIIIILLVIAGLAYFALNMGPKECPPSCDDGNVCTLDTCGEATGFRCAHTNLTGGQEGCSSDEKCVETGCSGGQCNTRELSNCCGNGKCETGETCTTCDDCTCDIGQSCTKAGQCKSGNCVGGKCKQAGDRCGNGVCDPAEGCATCTTDCACPSDSECTDNTCTKKCGNGVCGSDETCTSCPTDCGACKLPPGGNCTAGSACISGFCVHGKCRNESTYCGDGFCDAGENCTACDDCCLAFGKPCTKDSQCLSRHCVHGKCRNESTYCGDDYCDKNESCVDDCGHYADFMMCTHDLNCDGNDTLFLESQRKGMEWEYGGRYCRSGTCIATGIYEFEVKFVDDDSASLLYSKPDGTRDTLIVGLDDCESAGAVFICLDYVE